MQEIATSEDALETFDQLFDTMTGPSGSDHKKLQAALTILRTDIHRLRDLEKAEK